MRGFIAALYKDMKLMLNGTGLITLVFSLMLLPLFWWGTRDLSAADVVRPFPITVCDLDETVMSRSLIAQIREIELFSEVRVIGNELDPEGIGDSTAAGAGNSDVAGIVTVPKDFFYAMYRGEDCPVTLTLNENMQLQAALLQSVFTSVMDIISADQSAWRGVYAYAYGETLTDAQLEQLYEDASKDLFTDALSRQSVFESALSGSDLPGVLRRRLAAVLLMMLSVLFTLSALKTLPQEWNMGALIRYRAMGASLFGFIFSKLLTCIFWMLPMALLLFFLSGLTVSTLNVWLFALLTLAMLLASFGCNLLFVALTGEEDGASRLSNMYLLLSLFFGGTLLSVTLLSERFAVLQKLITGAYVLPVLNAMDTGEETVRILMRMLPLIIIFVVTAATAAVCSGIQKKAAKKEAARPPVVTAQSETAFSKSTKKRQAELFGRDCAVRKSFIPRFFPIAGMKLILYAGGLSALIVILTTAALSGAAAKRSTNFKSGIVSVAVQDDDDTQASRELVELVGRKASDSVKIIPCKAGEGETLMVDLKVEGLLVIGAGYEAALLSNALIPLDYQSTASAFSAQAVREVFAGQVAVQRAAFRAYHQAEKMSGQYLTETDREELRALITQASDKLAPLYKISYAAGEGAPDPFVPDKMSFLGVTVILILMTAAAYTGRRDARAVSLRLLGGRRGRLLSYGADLFSLTVMGIVVSLCFLIPAGHLSLRTLTAAILLSLNMSAFSLMITGFTYGAGRVDGLAPLFTLIICLLGGCFLDISALSETARNLMSLSPAGAALLFVRGSSGAAAVMLAELILFVLPGMNRKKS